MNTPTQPLRDEHRELLPHIDRIRQVAEQIGQAPVPELRQGLDQVYEFLTRHLVPHAQAEDAALYPVVQKLLGSPLATRTMSRDHVEIGRYIEELALLKDGLSRLTPTGVPPESLRRILYGLYALVKVHFAKEEEVYLPILDEGLSPEEAREMFAAMEAAAHKAKAELHAN